LALDFDSVGAIYARARDLLALNNTMRIAAGFFLFAQAAFTQNVITVFAGADYRFPAQSLPALQAPLSTPTVITTDTKGNVYFGDSENLRVMRVSPDGTLTVVAGNGLLGNSGDGGPATSASFYTIAGLAVDAAGNIYIADRNFDVLRKVTPDGIISTIAGNSQPLHSVFAGDGGPAAKAQLGPGGLALDPSGNLYICDTANERIRKISPSGIITTVAGNGSAVSVGDGGSALAASLYVPLAIALDGAANLYVLEGAGGVIRKINPQGIISTALTGATGTSFAVDAAGNLYYFGFASVNKRTAAGIVTTFAGNGTLGFSGDGGLATNAMLNGTKGLWADPAGNIYISDDGNQRVRKVSGGIITTVAGNGKFRLSPDGIPAVSASLFKPQAVAIDKTGNVYIAETGNHRVRKVGLDGIITTVAGIGTPGSSGDGGAAAAAQLNLPVGLAIDSSGNLYIAESNGNRVRKVTPGGVISTFAGNGTFTPDGEGVAAISVAVSFPQGLAVDAAGNLLITQANRIRKVTPGGVITTAIGGPAAACGPTPNGDGGPVSAAKLCNATAIAIDSAGNLYITDNSVTSRVRQVSGGTIKTVAGGHDFLTPFGAPLATGIFLNDPEAIAVDSAGNLYIAAGAGAYVLKVQPSGAYAFYAGIGAVGVSANEGQLATRAGIDRPMGLAFDSAGNLYIADAGYFFDSSSYRVWKVLAQPPSFSLSQPSLTFTGSAGGAPPSLQRFTAIAGVNGVPFAVKATTSDGGTWLTTNPTAGNTARIVEVTADPGNLVPGDYQGTLTVTAQNTAPTVQSVAVSFHVTAAQPASLQTDQESLTFGFPRQGTPRSQTLKVSNAGGGNLDFTATAATVAGASWLAVSPASGTATARTSVPLTVTADPTGLSPGTYSGAIQISGAQSKTIPVLLTVSTFDKAILLTQTGLSFTSVAAGGVTPPQSFGVLNVGTGSMPFTVKTSTLTGGGWLSVTPASSISDASSNTVPSIEVDVDQTNLGAGVYYGLVRVDAPGAANSPQVVTVFLQVLPAGSAPGSVVQPSELTFSGVAASFTPGGREVVIYNLSGTPVSYVSQAFINGIGSTRHTPISAVVQPQSPVRMLIQPNFDSLGPGETLQNLTLLFSDGTVRPIALHLIAAPPPPAGSSAGLGDAAAGGRDAGGCTPTQLLPAFQSLGQASSAPAGWPAAMTVDVKDDCGQPLINGGVTVSFSNGDLPISLASLKDGTWQGTWQNRNPGVAQVAVTVRAQDAQQKLSCTREISAALQAAQTPPATAPNAIVSAAAPVSYVPLAPGTLFSIYGDHLAESVASATNIPLPTTLGNTQVILAGQTLPLVFVSPGQINAFAPYTLQTDTQQQILINRGVTYSFPIPVNVAASQPGIYTYPSNSGSIPYVVTVRGTDQFLATPDKPARAGDVLVIYCGGLGGVTTPVTAGAATPLSPLAQVAAGLTITIGGTDIPVGFAGLTPGSVGLYQVNVTLPPGITTGNSVPIVLSTAGQSSPPVGLAIQN
jgi:uncharacterized protein (TIGR03437 family)